MPANKRIIAAVVGALLLIGIGAGVVVARSGDDEPLTGRIYDRATEAALDHVGSGTVVETEAGDAGAAYGVEVERDDGTVVEVSLDEDFNVIGTERDDDGPGDVDEPGDDD